MITQDNQALLNQLTQAQDQVTQRLVQDTITVMNQDANKEESDMISQIYYGILDSASKNSNAMYQTSKSIQF